MVSWSATAASQQQRYLILTYAAEYDRVHYPLPLAFVDCPTREQLERTIDRLREVCARQVYRKVCVSLCVYLRSKHACVCVLCLRRACFCVEQASQLCPGEKEMRCPSAVFRASPPLVQRCATASSTPRFCWCFQHRRVLGVPNVNPRPRL